MQNRNVNKTSVYTWMSKYICKKGSTYMKHIYNNKTQMLNIDQLSFWIQNIQDKKQPKPIWK